MFFFCLIVQASLAQDIILKTNGDEIQSKVVEIDAEKVKYKKYENPDGPLYSIAVAEVFMIRYANGSKDVMTSIEKQLSPVLEVKHSITGDWINKLIANENIRISEENGAFFMTIKGTKAPLSEIKSNEYSLDGSSLRVYSVSNDSLIMKDIADDKGPNLYLTRVMKPEIVQPASTVNKSMVGIALSTGFGASYGGIGVNAALRLGSRNFSFQPNIGIGLFTYTLDGTMPIVFGAKMYIDNFYIGYRYGYIGSAYLDNYYYTDFVDVEGSVLVFGSDWYIGKKKNLFLTSGFGINISGIDLEINDADFDLGFGVRF